MYLVLAVGHKADLDLAVLRCSLPSERVCDIMCQHLANGALEDVCACKKAGFVGFGAVMSKERQVCPILGMRNSYNYTLAQCSERTSSILP